MLEQIIGIDTSCYTTSLAIIDGQGLILKDQRLLLQVKPGERGLRQSEAVFQHLQNLPLLMDRPLEKPAYWAVVASVKPRPVSGSYLPVFRVGASFAETLATLLGVPFIQTSHQEGHLRVGTYGTGELKSRFLAWHISGGTTELLLAEPAAIGYTIKKIGGSTDLQVGQFVDRVGVELGIGFPAGPLLEKMALTSSETGALPVVTRDLTVSFSGPSSAAQRLIATGKFNGPALARQVFNCIARSILKVTQPAVVQYGIDQVLVVGGVAANRIIRETLLEQGIKDGIAFHFGPKELSSDNAVGVGLIGYDYLRKGTNNGR